MGMLVTTIAFAGVTALAVVHHLRRGAGRENAAPAAAAQVFSPCPRCGGHVRKGSANCPWCHVPMQAFEYVNASLAPDTPESDDATVDGVAGGKRKHALVRADVCVGCGTCTAGCPEKGAIRVENKRAIIDTEICIGHGHCVSDCPVGAIVLSTGDAVQHVVAPEIDANFQTNIRGLYIAGELGGRGLIKNAINEGKIAAEHIASRSIAGGARPRAGSSEPGVADLVVVGAGPAGISAGLEAMASGLSCVVLERGTLADSIRKYPRHKLLLAEPVRVPLYGDLWVADATKEALLEAWEAVIAGTGLDVRTGHEVSGIEREGGLFTVRAGERVFRCGSVVLAMGRRGTPRKLGVPGEELGKVFYDIVEMEAFAGRRVLVIGGGDSAVEAAVGLGNQPGAEVSLSYRGQSFKRVKERNTQKLERAAAAGRVRLMLGSQVREIRRDAVVLERDGKTVSLPNDDVIIRIGGEAPYAFLERTGVRLVRKEVRIVEDAAKVA